MPESSDDDIRKGLYALAALIKNMGPEISDVEVWQFIAEAMADPNSGTLLRNPENRERAAQIAQQELKRLWVHERRN